MEEIILIRQDFFTGILDAQVSGVWICRIFVYLRNCYPIPSSVKYTIGHFMVPAL